jgi:hypothetical protein
LANFSHLMDNNVFLPHLSATANVNVFLHGLASGDSINLSAFTLRFVQTGSATTAGDFNSDGRVNGGDFVVWQRGLSPNPRSPQDLALWRMNFGQSIAAVPAVMATPEPTSALLLLTAMFAYLVRPQGGSAH